MIKKPAIAVGFFRKRDQTSPAKLRVFRHILSRSSFVCCKASQFLFILRPS